MEKKDQSRMSLRDRIAVACWLVAAPLAIFTMFWPEKVVMGTTFGDEVLITLLVCGVVHALVSVNVDRRCMK